MRAPGNKLLAAFLGLSVIFFAVAMFVGEDAPDEPGVGASIDPDMEARRDGARGGIPEMQDDSAPAMQRAAMDSAVNAMAAATVALDPLC